jgi:phosphinothricin acetyltransferase
MRIRSAAPSDFGAIAALTNRYIETTAIHFSYEPVTAHGLLALFEQYRARYPWIVAEIDGRFAGYAKAGPWRDRAAYDWTPEAGIYIEPEFHRRGVGRALYTRLFEVLRAQGYQTLIAGATLPNDASALLHEAVGFVKVGHVHRAGWKMNRWWDVGFWQKDLAPPGAPATPIKPPSFD